MDEESDPDDQNVNSVLAQESSELLPILSSQGPEVIMKLCQMVPGDAGWSVNRPASSAAALTGRIKAMLEYFRQADAAHCRNFLQSMCMLCENIPMRLESRLMSVAGYANSECKVMLKMLASNARRFLQFVRASSVTYSPKVTSVVRWPTCSPKQTVKQNKMLI